MHEGKLGRDRLAHDNSAFLLEPLHDESIPQRNPVRITRAAVLCRDFRRIDHVLQCDRQPVQTPKRASASTVCIEIACLRTGKLGIEPCPRADFSLAGLNPRDVAVYQRQRVQRTGCQTIAQQRHTG